MKLRDRVAIVVGASGDIGSATVRLLSAAGAHVVLAAPANEVPIMDRIAAEVERNGVRALVVPTDITVRAEVDRLVATTLDVFGTIDVLANVAGIGSAPSLCDESDDGLERIIAVNLLGCARTIHAVLPVMKIQRRGSIINVGSIAGEVGVMGIYSAAKFGLRGLTDSVRREARSANVGVTLIAPGFVRGRLNHAMGDGLPSPAVVARAIVRAAVRPKRCVIVPAYWALPVYAGKLFPGVFDRIFGNARIQDRLNRDARADAARLAR